SRRKVALRSSARLYSCQRRRPPRAHRRPAIMKPQPTAIWPTSPVIEASELRTPPGPGQAARCPLAALSCAAYARVVRLNQITVRVHDIARAIAFYRTLG